MKPKNFSEKWDKEEDVNSHSFVKRNYGWKQYAKWIVILLVIIFISILLQKLL